MSTVLYPTPIYGPVMSRRLGLSLGVNLMPSDGKVCTFDCIYCECGFNADHRPHSPRPTREQVYDALEKKLQEMSEQGILPDSITFAGNGEPTSHPQFYDIIYDTVALRNYYCKKSKISVLTNGTLINRENVFNALMQVDNNIVKLDAANQKYVSLVNQPLLWYNIEAQVKLMKKFKGHVIIQTMFMRGTYKGQDVSNLSNDFVLPWLKALLKIKPSAVQIYTVDRETPDSDLHKATREELDRIVERVQHLGFEASASY